MEFFAAAFAGLDSDFGLLRFDFGSTTIILRVLRNKVENLLPNQLELHSMMSPIVGHSVTCQGVGDVMSPTEAPDPTTWKLEFRCRSRSP